MELKAIVPVPRFQRNTPGEFEIVKHFPGLSGLKLLLFICLQRRERKIGQLEWVDDLIRSWGLWRAERRQGMQDGEHGPAARRFQPPTFNVSVFSFCHGELFESVFQVHAQIPDIVFELNGFFSTAGPANPKRAGSLRAAKHLSCRVLGPVTASCGYSPAGTETAFTVAHAHLRADRFGISKHAAGQPRAR